MRFIPLILATAATIGLAACTAERDEPAANVDVETNANMADDNMAGTDDLTAPAAGDAQAFATTIGGSDLYEIEAGKLASTKATDAKLKQFGAMLQADHGQSSVKLKAAAAKAGVTLPTAVPAEHQPHLDQLKAASGAEFDKAFVQQQIDGHTKALATLDSYANGGSQPDLKAFAAEARVKVKAHLDQLTAMR